MNEDPAPIHVARVQKNSREEIRFDLNTFKGHRLVSARVWAKKEDGTEIPTKSGLTIRVSLIGDVRKALALVEHAAFSAGWLVSIGEQP
jgi:hypothetical protein